MTGPRSGNSSGDPFFADPRSLEPDQLVALVGRLQAELDRRQAVIDQQAAAIADLQRRGGGGAPPAPPPRRDAKPVAGHDFTVVFDGGSIGNPGRGYGSYQIVAPTTWNFSPRDTAGEPGPLERALVGVAAEAHADDAPVAVQHVVRSFDPCMVCTVH